MAAWNEMSARIFVATEWSEKYDDCQKKAAEASNSSLVHLFIYEYEDDGMEIASNIDFWIYQGFSFAQVDSGNIEIRGMFTQHLFKVVTSYQEAIDYIENFI